MKKIILFWLSAIFIGNIILAQQETISWDNNTTTQDNVSSDVNTLDTTNNADNNTEDEVFFDWWYTENDEIKVKEVSKDYVVLESPVVKDAAWENVTTYRIIYSTEPIDSANIDNINDKIINITDINGDTIELRLDWLKPNTTYYITIEPRDILGEAGAVSNQIDVTTKSDEPEHEAAVESLKDITYSFTWSTITVNWNAADNVNSVDVFIKKDQDTDFTKVSTVNAKDWKADITVTESGLYIVKLVPLNDKGEALSDGYNLSVKVDKVEKPAIKKAPTVGPASNIILLAILLTILWYFFLKVYRRS